jgi:hypothetical protein
MDAQQQTTNPLHVMEDGELVSRMIIARDHGDNELFRHFRKEVMYRLRCADLKNWAPPKRFPNSQEQENV